MRDELQTLVGGIESSVGPRLPTDGEAAAPFFGRGPELAALRRAIGAVRTDGLCRAVTFIGASGIGKTRLLDEFARDLRLLDDPPIRVFRSTSPTGAKWSSFTQVLTQRFEIGETNGHDESKASVRTHIMGVLEDRKIGDVLYMLGDLLDLEFPPSPVTKALEEGSPEATGLKRAILKSFIEADANFGPICLLFDDLHLCHDDTLSMLRSLIEHLKAPVLVVCAALPELLARADAVPATASHQVIHLEPLTALDSAALIGSLLTPDGMTPMYLVEKARSIAGGNPGRIEEVTRFYRDKGTLPPPTEGDRATTAARLEQLTPEERLLLQQAAIMGGVFWLGGLIVLDRDGREAPEPSTDAGDPGVLRIATTLARLTERDYLFRLPDSTFAGDEEYVFRHRTERDRIQALVSTADARKWHRLLADWLDSQPETRSHEEYLELLAQQREKAGASESAASAYLEAAGQARAHASAKRELAYYERALALLGDGGGSRLFALMRTAELLEPMGKLDVAHDRFREAATLAFRLNRKRAWEGAHLAATRLAEVLATRAEAERRAAQPASLIPEPPNASVPADEASAADDADDFQQDDDATDDVPQDNATEGASLELEPSEGAPLELEPSEQAPRETAAPQTEPSETAATETEPNEAAAPETEPTQTVALEGEPSEAAAPETEPTQTVALEGEGPESASSDGDADASDEAPETHAQLDLQLGTGEAQSAEAFAQPGATEIGAEATPSHETPDHPDEHDETPPASEPDIDWVEASLSEPAIELPAEHEPAAAAPVETPSSEVDAPTDDQATLPSPPESHPARHPTPLVEEVRLEPPVAPTETETST